MFARFPQKTVDARRTHASILASIGVCLAVSLQARPAAAEHRILFETNIGDFELILNPLGIAEVQSGADRLRDLAEAGHFDNTIINRADPTGVVQFGTFEVGPTTVEEVTAPGFPGFSGVTLPPGLTEVRFDDDGNGTVDFDFLGMGLTNRRGTVAFALGSGQINPTGGSIFVSTVDNPFNIDGQNFVPIAFVPDLTVIDAIQNLPQVAFSGATAFRNFPTIQNASGPTELVIIERASVLIPEPTTIALALAAAALGCARVRPR